MRDVPDFAAIGMALAANRQTAVIYVGADGRIGFWNAGAERLFGHASGEVAGRRVDLIVPETYRAMHWQGFERAIGSPWRGSMTWGPVEALHKTGQLIPLEVFLTPVQDADERATGVVAFFRTAATPVAP